MDNDKDAMLKKLNQLATLPPSHPRRKRGVMQPPIPKEKLAPLPKMKPPLKTVPLPKIQNWEE